MTFDLIIDIPYHSALPCPTMGMIMITDSMFFMASLREGFKKTIESLTAVKPHPAPPLYL